LLEDRLGLLLAERLSQAAVGHDITERLRVAREAATVRAAAARRTAPAAVGAPVRVGSGQLAMSPLPWWWRLASWGPLVVLALGLMMVQELDSAERVRAAADIDAVLLADDLPPQAYADPGFTEFLKQPFVRTAP
jgi:hypothetical protein